jgi:hypothetical protein
VTDSTDNYLDTHRALAQPVDHDVAPDPLRAGAQAKRVLAAIP